MPHGFDKLDELFSASRRKKRAAYGKVTAERKGSVICPPCASLVSEEGSLFPSPSFMKPTSMRMQPRQPTYEGPIEDELHPAQDKGRARSLPVVPKQLRRRSSACSVKKAESKTRSYEPNRPSSFAVEHERDSQATLRLSRFRFPEDALFRSPEAVNSPTYVSFSESLGDETSVETPQLEPMPDFKLLDWSPKHISMLYNPLEPSSVAGNLDPGKGDSTDKSMILMPSPLFTAPTKPPPKLARQTTPPRTPSPRSRPSVGTSSWDYPSFPEKYSAFKTAAHQAYSPPASDSEEEYTSFTLDRSKSLSALNTLAGFTPKQQSEAVSWETSVLADPERLTPQEAGAIELNDLKVSSPSPKTNSILPRSRFGKTRGAATLSVVTSKIEDDHVLQEPTISDIYSLSDEDIAEMEPTTPVPHSWIPPPPLPKDKPKQSVCKPITNEPVFTNHIAIDPGSGEMTPPETPTDSQFLAPMPVNQPAGALGAIMAAGIAKKYNFDLVFLISLWPNGGSSHMDPSIRVSSGSYPRTVTPGGSIVVHPKSRLTGRYLAAFGLSQVSEPFQIQTRVLLKTLCSKGWNEYREPTAAISRGWTCSFDSDYVPSAETDSGKSLGKAMNRGIVFAAYNKRNSKSAIPNKTSPEMQEILAELSADVRVLVDTLVGRV